VDQTAIDRVIASAAAAGRASLSEIESKQIVAALGIATAIPVLARTADEAAKAGARCGFPVVLKVVSPDVTHKSEAGGVALNIDSEVAARTAFDRIRVALHDRNPDAHFDGVAVEPMAQPGVELLAGIVRDESYGPLVMVGLGGIFVEVLNDTATRLAPVNHGEARAMLEELRGAAMLRGVRGKPPVDIEAVADLLVKLSEFASRREDIREMDLNPVVAHERGLEVLDARVLVGPPSAAKAVTPRSPARLENLKRGLEARTAVVFGDKRAIDYMWLRALKPFTGKLYSIQIDPREIPGIEAMGIVNVKSLAEVPERVDYAVASVPRQIAPRILKDCATHGVAAVSFFTSGFSETGEELGTKLEAELRDVALTSDIALVGPNCMGLCNPAIGLRNFPDEPAGEGGGVCYMSQSGTHTINFCTQAPARGIGINKAASIGNVTVLDAADYLDVMTEDPATTVIGMYIEGARDGRRFFESLKRAAARHPVVVWKGGVTESGARASFSHTGSLATPSAVWRAVIRQSGAVEVPGHDAMLDAVELLARGRRVGGRRMGLVAMTGGQSVFITDAFASAGLEIPRLSPASYEELKGFFNIIGGSYRNPLDAGGTIGHGLGLDNLGRILGILEADPVIDSIVLEIATGLRASRWVEHEDELSGLLDKLGEFNRSAAKAFAVILHPAHLEQIVVRVRQMARERGLVVFESFERAAAAFRVAADYWTGRLRRA
jgi:acetate---CoA ligase (ADP-forming) subunit alpha